MKIPVIKALVENYNLETLQKAEADLYEEQKPEIEVDGEDEGEQLTHLIAAIWIKNDMNINGSALNASLRNYTQKVRKSID